MSVTVTLKITDNRSPTVSVAATLTVRLSASLTVTVKLYLTVYTIYHFGVSFTKKQMIGSTMFLLYLFSISMSTDA